MHEPLRCWDFSRINPKLFISNWFSPCGSGYNTVLSHTVTSNSATPWTVAHQPPLSLGFPRQEYWSGLSCPPPGDLPDAGIEPESLVSPALAGGFFTPEPRGKPSSPCNTHFTCRKTQWLRWTFNQNLQPINNSFIPWHPVVPNLHTLLTSSPTESTFSLQLIYGVHSLVFQLIRLNNTLLGSLGKKGNKFGQ